MGGEQLGKSEYLLMLISQVCGTVVVKEALLPVDVCYVMLARTCFGLFGRRNCTQHRVINQVWQEVNRWLTWDVDLSLYFQWMKQNLNSSRCLVAARSVGHIPARQVRAMNWLETGSYERIWLEVSRTWGKSLWSSGRSRINRDMRETWADQSGDSRRGEKLDSRVYFQTHAILMQVPQVWNVMQIDTKNL